MDPAPTHYVDRDGAALAYQVIGDGPADIVAAFELGMHLDLCWTDPDIHRNYERLAGFSRFACFQPRGFGLSETISYTPTIEQQADDILAVMDAVGMRRATLMGVISTCGAMALAAARAPERVHSLVFYIPLAYGWAAREDTHGWTAAAVDAYLADVQHAIQHWGSGETIGLWEHAWTTNLNRRLSAMLERSSGTPAAAHAYMEAVLDRDVRDVFKSVQAPTRVLWPEALSFPAAYGRYMASLVPGATFQLLPESPPGSSIGQGFVPVWDHLEEVATGAAHSSDADRFLGTVVFTDVVGSTELLADVGDEKYQDLRADHERVVRLRVEAADGQLMSVMGDGTMSVFESPSKAVRCAESILAASADGGLRIRAGVHTGELQRDGMNVTGMTVHIGARVGAVAGSGEVWVSRTVHDLLVGSGLTFASRGEHELKGVPGAWELFALSQAGQQAETVPIEESMQTPADKMAVQVARRAPALSRSAVRVANAIQRRRARVT
jgi:class 3 adenylate cyclase/pimeloyl-ACP methyl ester carboxylesterase